MKQIFALLLSSLLSMVFLHAQDKEFDADRLYYKTGCKSHFVKIELPETVSEKSVVQFIKNYLPNLKSERVELKLNYMKESLVGFHYSFTQTVDGVEIYQSEVKVNTDKARTVLSVFDNSEDTYQWPILSSQDKNVVAMVKDTRPVLAKRQLLNDIEILSVNGEVVFTRDTRSFALPDSTATGKVFNPDPLTTAQVYYGFPYNDRGDSTNASLDAQRQQKNFTCTFDGLQFILENQYVRIVDFELPTVAPVVSSQPVFNFDRSDSGFEDVNVFYHINAIRNYVSGLGFTLANGLVDADSHAFNGQDNSYFSPNNSPPRISYGTGGVDDAEDADVVVHEYGHFLSESAAPGSNVGHERKSLDEGFCDYLCASYSKSLSSFDNYNIYNWDGHNEFWNGRIINTNRVYPTNLNPSNIYRNGEMWSTALFNLHNEIGRAATDSLLFEAQYGYAQDMKMDDAAYLLVQADVALFNGKYYCPIFRHMWAQGFLPFNPNNPCGISGLSDTDSKLSFTVIPDANGFKIFNPKHELLTVNVYAISGKLMNVYVTQESEYYFSGTDWSHGLYLVEIGSFAAHKVFKWIN